MPAVGDTVRVISDMLPAYFNKEGIIKSVNPFFRFPYEVIFMESQKESFQSEELKVVKRA